MRTATFLGLCGLIAGGIVILLQIPIAYFGVRSLDLGWEFLNAILEITGSWFFKGIEIAAVLPVVAYLLNPLNQKLRVWRKMRGRDIEEEEKYETEFGFISLTEKKR